jgi:hypothetical protein
MAQAFAPLTPLALVLSFGLMIAPAHAADPAVAAAKQQLEADKAAAKQLKERIAANRATLQAARAASQQRRMEERQAKQASKTPQL